jgi:hypothetical protein
MRYLLAITACLAAGVQAADLSAVKSVYLMPMSRGLDQYLAQRLAAGNRFQVVTDPTKADAFFTDRIGSNFEESLTQLLEPKSIVEKKDDSTQTYKPPAMQPLSRGKGNVFLVDRQSHAIIWSAFAPAKGTDVNELSKIAEHLADQLTKTK